MDSQQINHLKKKLQEALTLESKKMELERTINYLQTQKNALPPSCMEMQDHYDNTTDLTYREYNIRSPYRTQEDDGHHSFLGSIMVTLVALVGIVIMGILIGGALFLGGALVMTILQMDIGSEPSPKWMVICFLIGCVAFGSYMMEDRGKYKNGIQQMKDNYDETLAVIEKCISQDKRVFRATTKNIAVLSSSLLEVNAELEKLYAEDFIFQKYRTFCAVAQILEYFQSGRCTDLTGPDGAYNLYEAELRANIIIAKMDQILNGLEQIKENQYLIYNELQKINGGLAAVQDELIQIRDAVSATGDNVMMAVQDMSNRY